MGHVLAENEYVESEMRRRDFHVQDGQWWTGCCCLAIQSMGGIWKRSCATSSVPSKRMRERPLGAQGKLLGAAKLVVC